MKKVCLKKWFKAQTERYRTREAKKYAPEVLGKGRACCKTVTIESGATIEVSKVLGELPEYVGGFNHRIYSNGSNGDNTLLEFSLSPDACMALLHLYLDHGLLSNSNRPQ